MYVYTDNRVRTVGTDFAAVLALSGWGYADFHAGGNFVLTEFSEVGWVLVCAAFLLQHLLAGASDLHSDVPKGAYGLLSLVPYAPKIFLVRPRALVLFQPLVHLEDTPKHCFCPVLQLQQRCVRSAQKDYPLVAYLAWPLAFSF
jgi:hypothetical protein